MADAIKEPEAKIAFTDSIQNFAGRLGIGPGSDNIAASSTYGFNPITRNRILCDWMYRGSWIARQVVNAIPNDMTRAGIRLTGSMEAKNEKALFKSMKRTKTFAKCNDGMKWARLYGGCVGYVMIEGQEPATPLRVETVGRQQFKGVLPLDRWTIQPDMGEMIAELGPDIGKPAYYRTMASAYLPPMRIHRSRLIFFAGEELPYWQSLGENFWDLSVLEPLYDRLVAFDSTTQGAAQLVYKAHLRTVKFKGLRQAIALGGDAITAITETVQMMRKYASFEGLTLIDADDAMEISNYTFSGLDLVLIQFAQQLSGAAQIPLTRLFGQSPAGLNATGESDLRFYYDAVASRQESDLEAPYATLLEIAVRSEFGVPPPEDMGFDFVPLWQISMKERAEIAEISARLMDSAVQSGLVSRPGAMETLRQLSQEIGYFDQISDADIADAEAEAQVPKMPEGASESGSDGDPGTDLPLDADNVVKMIQRVAGG